MRSYAGTTANTRTSLRISGDGGGRRAVGVCGRQSSTTYTQPQTKALTSINANEMRPCTPQELPSIAYVRTHLTADTRLRAHPNNTFHCPTADTRILFVAQTHQICTSLTIESTPFHPHMREWQAAHAGGDVSADVEILLMDLAIMLYLWSHNTPDTTPQHTAYAKIQHNLGTSAISYLTPRMPHTPHATHAHTPFKGRARGGPARRLRSGACTKFNSHMRACSPNSWNPIALITHRLTPVNLSLTLFEFARIHSYRILRFGEQVARSIMMDFTCWKQIWNRQIGLTHSAFWGILSVDWKWWYGGLVCNCVQLFLLNPHRDLRAQALLTQ